ncbi:unnamed protein product [Rodentolepis nana]|uniref:Mediator of RNA polymerase II transcription subunit 13 n=1 Tax=Rodentolepis nana TaxID=102285 RepID=A0A0R3TBZ0_RODNA|nr:unnamed protein product [Rodentolepis nana]
MARRLQTVLCLRTYSTVGYRINPKLALLLSDALGGNQRPGLVLLLSDQPRVMWHADPVRTLANGSAIIAYPLDIVASLCDSFTLLADRPGTYVKCLQQQHGALMEGNTSPIIFKCLPALTCAAKQHMHYSTSWDLDKYASISTGD